MASNELSMEARAGALGIPMQIDITDDIRHEDCDAHMANLTGIEGRMAIYKGECNVGHNYETRFQIEDLKRMAHIENGKIVYGAEKSFEAPPLEEF